MIERRGKDSSGIEWIHISGDIGRAELLDLMEAIDQLESQSSHFIALYDFRLARVKLTLDDLDALKIKSRNTFTPDTHIRCAFLTSNAEQAAFCIYYKLDNQQLNIQREVFSHPESAISWLLETDS